MRDTVLVLIGDADPATHDRIRASIEEMVASVAAYVLGYRLKQAVQTTPVLADQPVHTPAGDALVTHQVSSSSRWRGPHTTCRPTPATSTS